MSLSRHNITLLVAMLSGALLLTNAGVGYLHLCFDGQEPPVTLHLVGDALHANGNANSHSDQDVDPAKAAPVKLLWQGIDMPAAAMAFALQLPFQRSRAFERSGLLLRPSSATSYLRPYLRAPPF